MKYHHLVWPQGAWFGEALSDQPATNYWTQATALGDPTFRVIPEFSDLADHSCLDRSLSELEDLLKALDAYDIEH